VTITLQLPIIVGLLGLAVSNRPLRNTLMPASTISLNLAITKRGRFVKSRLVFLLLSGGLKGGERYLIRAYTEDGVNIIS